MLLAVLHSIEQWWLAQPAPDPLVEQKARFYYAEMNAQELRRETLRKLDDAVLGTPPWELR